MAMGGWCQTGGKPAVNGYVEENIEQWFHHLDTTLFEDFSHESQAAQNSFFNADNNFIVTAIRTKANRNFQIRCSTCQRWAAGSYNRYTSETDCQEVQAEWRESIEQFLLL